MAKMRGGSVMYMPSLLQSSPHGKSVWWIAGDKDARSWLLGQRLRPGFRPMKDNLYSDQPQLDHVAASEHLRTIR